MSTSHTLETQPAPERERQLALDGLRGLAAMTVVLTHFLAAFWPQVLHGNYPTSFPAPTQSSLWLTVMQLPVLNMGYAGAFAVAVFFVLSGHVLAQGSAAGPARALFLRRALARWLRLGLPVAGAVLLTYAVFRLGGMYHQEAGFLPGYGRGLSWWDALLEALLGMLWPGWTRINPPVWSLLWEFWGSMALLGLLVLLGQSGRAWRVALWLLAGAAWLLLGGASTYLLAMWGGALRAHATRGRSGWRWAALAVAVYCGGFQYDHAWYGWAGLLGADHGLQWQLKEWCNLLGALALVDAVRQGVLERLLTARPVLWLGRVSFSLYLLHVLVLMSLGLGLGLVLPGSMGTSERIWLVLAGYLCACLLVAAAFERWVDRPAIALAQAVARHLVRRLGTRWPAAMLRADYGLLLPLLARLPTPWAYRAGTWRSRWHCRGRRDWAELTVGEPYVHERATRVCAQLRQAGYPIPNDGVAQRYDTVGREELDAHRLARYGWQRFRTRTEALASALAQRAPGCGLVVLSMHFDKSLVGVAGIGMQGLATYAAASNLTQDERIALPIRNYFELKYQAAGRLMAGGGFVYIETGLRRLVRALRKGEVVCVFADVPAAGPDADGQWVPWLGAERKMQTLGLRMAMESGSEMMGLVCTHDADHGATWHCTPVVPADEVGTDAYLRVMAFLESWVGHQPCRWWALHQLLDYPQRPVATAAALEEQAHV